MRGAAVLLSLWSACHTQSEIADAVGVPRQTVTDWEGKALLAVKKKAGHGGWKSLFVPPTDGEKGRFDWRENRPFDFNWTQAKSYLKVATYPTLARTALLEDDGERRYLLWKSCTEQSTEWVAKRKAAQDEANRARSAAAVEQHKVSKPRVGEAVSGPATGCGETKTRDHEAETERKTRPKPSLKM